ncbi:biotin/lipoyl-binding protein [Roseibium sp. RKSG952]|uniref:HlyD family secretion protein n=1 Tax=Roseibium sp. RKSG952 TaxID=2529384 RepID=UPI0012BC7DEC
MSWLLNRVTLIVFFGAILIFALIEGSRSVIVYSGDAYVTTDVVTLAPQVPGVLAEIKVRRDQKVQKGDLLFTLDPTLFQLTLDAKNAELKQAQAAQQRAGAAIAEVQADISAAQSMVAQQQQQMDRFSKLVESGDVSTAAMDAQTERLAAATAQLSKVRAALKLAQDTQKEQVAAVEAARRAVAIAEYDLKQTRVFAPTSGMIAPYVATIGDYFARGENVLAVIDDTRWQIVANLYERDLAGLTAGTPVVFTLSTEGWRFHTGSVDSLSSAIALSSVEPRVVPYVNPQTDWVRLPKRFPVRIDMGDLPQRQRVFMGSDVDLFVVRAHWLARFLGLSRKPVAADDVSERAL